MFFLPAIKESVRRLRPNLPNRWDFVAFPLIISIIVLGSTAFQQTLAPLSELMTIQTISLDPCRLPEYALRTTLRMLAAMLAALVFTLLYGTLAANSRRAEKILVPALDVLQSVPVLGYISFTVTFFITLFPGRVLGAECAAIFAIFTSQAWNMTFGFYQSQRTLPPDLIEVTRNFQLTRWQRFWKLDVPFALPSLIWNMMMSMSGGWFFVVASEAITVGHTTIFLPGIGSYLAQAISERNLAAVGWVIFAMIVVVLAYDQFLFRPLVAWADKFRIEDTRSQSDPESWLLDLIRRTRLIQRLLYPLGSLLRVLAHYPLKLQLFAPAGSPSDAGRIIGKLWTVLILGITGYAATQVVMFVSRGTSISEVGYVFGLGGFTLLRVVVLIALASIIWVPIGVQVGLRPRLAQKIQPLAQLLAAFPANLLFPLFVIGIAYFHANPDIWLSPLMILGTQWYILFNVIAGAAAYPNDFKEVTASFRIRGWQWWRQAMLPAIFPYYVTGALTASGGAWNASIVAEMVVWGETRLQAHGLGAYIAHNTRVGDYPKIILGIAVMSLFVVLLNRLLWRPMYAYAEAKLRSC